MQILLKTYSFDIPTIIQPPPVSSPTGGGPKDIFSHPFPAGEREGDRGCKSFDIPTIRDPQKKLLIAAFLISKSQIPNSKISS